MTANPMPKAMLRPRYLPTNFLEYNPKISPK